jgi:hypothetical protein
MGSFPLDFRFMDLLQNLFLIPPVFKAMCTIIEVYLQLNLLLLSKKRNLCLHEKKKKNFKAAYKLLLCLQKGIQITEISEGSEILLCTHHSYWGQKAES